MIVASLGPEMPHGALALAPGCPGACKAGAQQPPPSHNLLYGLLAGSRERGEGDGRRCDIVLSSCFVLLIQDGFNKVAST